MTKPKHSNRLAQETSPYLLQHAHNPVDWYPWGDAALEKARQENKLILLSIGYSACHWCHVMEHESFEDEATADVMNRLFVNIKVDREERPDLDKIYQTAHQMLAQRPGGWPLNMFLDPHDHMPVFGGTYFPKKPSHGMPAFTDILQRLAHFYQEQRDEIDKQSASLAQAFARLEQIAPGEQPPDSDILDQARSEIGEHFDRRYGGFGRAPKFPHPTTLERCLRHWADSMMRGQPDDEALHIANFSLQAMAAGGVYDQLGGGFCRYSVDDQWMIPHFEKMLYDNAQLLGLYADAALACDDAAFARTAEHTAHWVMREMQAPEGGYYSSLDADSEGEEGKFYAWESQELKALLNEPQWQALVRRYGLDGKPNFEGKWNLHCRQPMVEIAASLGINESEVQATLDDAHKILFEAREQRTRPGRDDKILTSWNGLMIKGMARAGRLLQRQAFIDSAQHALDFVRANLWRDGRLLATSKDGKSHLMAYLDDYVFLLDGALELLQARWRDGDLEFISALAEILLQHFEDKTHGGFFFTADDHEKLVYRPKPDADEAIPSGNGVAAYVLQRLGHVLGETRYLQAADATLQALQTPMRSYPWGHASLLAALEEQINPTQTIILRGPRTRLDTWLQRCQRHYAPRRLTLAIPDDATDLPGLLAQRQPTKDQVTAYVCSGHACQAPVNSLEDLEPHLAQQEVRSD